LESRADNCCAGSTFAPIELSGKVCNVSPFSSSYDPIEGVPIGKAGTAFDHPSLGTLILIFEQVLYFGAALKDSLICPNQLRSNGLIFEDVPQSLAHGQLSMHAIVIPGEDIRLDLDLDGVISSLETRLPTEQELEECRWVNMTSPIEWEPYSTDFREQEDAFIAYSATVATVSTGGSGIALGGSLIGVGSAPERSVSEGVSKTPGVSIGNDNDTIEPETFWSMNDIDRKVAATSSLDRHSSATAEDLATRWGIGVKTAANTIKVTTQHGVRNVLAPISHRFRTRQAQLKYPHLRTNIYSDTMFSSTKSCRGNTCGQLFVKFSCFYPMDSKSGAGDALNEFVHDVGIPAILITDNVEEETLARWSEVCKHYLIKQWWTEPYSPWQNRAESEIGELKKQCRRVMHRNRAPEELWDHCMELVSTYRSLTAPPLSTLEGKTPYEHVLGETPDISEYLDFEFYQLVWYWDPAVAFPGDKRRLGCWLGVASDVGQALCYKILAKSGDDIARSTVCALTALENGDIEV